MKSIKEYVEQYIKDGFSAERARSLTAQQIILSKIQQSKYVDKILLKGGVIMYNMTHQLRRTTLDLDFDFIRFNIENRKNVELFINELNDYIPIFRIRIDGDIETLNQQDYKGKRVKLIISDSSDEISFKLDIGVHTLFAIKQESMCFSFADGEELSLRINPPEQIFSEKLYSLAKIGPTTGRFKDMDDMYYLIKNKSLDIKIVRECLTLLTINQKYELKDAYDVITKADECMSNRYFISQYNKSDGSWLGFPYDKIKDCIIEYIYQL